MRSLSKQVLGDRFFLWSLRMSFRPFFFDGVETPALRDHLAALSIPEPDLPEMGINAVPVMTQAGPLEAVIQTDLRAGPGAPVVIFHPDAAEFPPMESAKAIFPSPPEDGFNLIAIRAPLHGNRRDFRLAMASLYNFISVQSVCVGLTERLMDSASVADAPGVAVVGIGQGGYIANWHHHFFNTAQIYLPLLAGAAQGDALLSGYPLARVARRQADKIRAQLNLEWRTQDHANVFPVLGSADLVNRFNLQSRSYGDTPIEVWPASHKTITQFGDRIRAKLHRHLEDARWGGRLRA